MAREPEIFAISGTTEDCSSGAPLTCGWLADSGSGGALPPDHQAFGAGVLLLKRQNVGWLSGRAPRNLRRAWEIFRREGRVLPRLLREGLYTAEKTVDRLLGRAASIVRQSGDRLSWARDEARIEGEALFARLREAFSLIRSRLRP